MRLNMDLLISKTFFSTISMVLNNKKQNGAQWRACWPQLKNCIFLKVRQTAKIEAKVQYSCLILGYDVDFPRDFL